MRRLEPHSPTRRRTLGAGSLALVLLAAACSDDGREMREPGPNQDLSIITTTIDPSTGMEDVPAEAGGTGSAPDEALDTVSTTTTTRPATSVPTLPAAGGFRLTAPWADGADIDPRFTCDGDDVSPTLSWSGVPDDAVEVAIVMLDDDAVATGDGGFIHWVVAGIDPSVTALAEGELPAGAIEGTNGFGTSDAPDVGYGGPCPPPGEPAHTYRIEVHALDQQIELDDGVIGADLLAAIDFSSIERAVVLGTYGR